MLSIRGVAQFRKGIGSMGPLGRAPIKAFNYRHELGMEEEGRAHLLPCVPLGAGSLLLEWLAGEAVGCVWGMCRVGVFPLPQANHSPQEALR